ncbi:hypothetical protein ACNVED_15090 (plasmid) [Legionella sp. D16C41]|uniref:hypothetical protein n=1 Tax=Legionella sp. D16C41 TaxID=3402688 RepID=UPI003AF54A3D
MYMFKQVEKPVQKVFPLEAFQALAKYFLNQLIVAVPVINSNGITEASWSVGEQITQEQMKEFVNNLSQSLFDEMKDIKIVPGVTRPQPILICDIISYIEKAQFPKVCIPDSNLIKPMVSLIPDGRITFDDGYTVGDVYNPSKNINYTTPFLEDSDNQFDLTI